MLDAHSEAGFAVGTPFAGEGAYDFALHGHLTRRVSALGAVMLRHRLTAPPEEARATALPTWCLFAFHDTRSPSAHARNICPDAPPQPGLLRLWSWVRTETARQ
jgi:hypothetical protein